VQCQGGTWQQHKSQTLYTHPVYARKKTTNPIHLYCGNVHVYQTGNLSSHKDVHTHASSSLVLRNPVTVTFDLFDLRVNACRDPAMQYYVYAKFAVDSSSRLSFTARTQRQKETQSHR